MDKTIENRLTDWAFEAFSAAFPGEDLGPARLDVVPTNEEKFGDYQCNAAMALSKVLKRNPREIAQAALDAATLPSCIDRAELAGPGFINLFLSDRWLAECTEKLADDERLGLPLPEKPRTIVLDYAGPNIAKPMHIGHLRPCVIGNALDRIYRFLGDRVISDNHMGDWGTQFGLLILGYRNFLDEQRLAESPVEELERLYVTSYKKSEEDPSWKDQARAELVKLQQGDKENRRLWTTFVALSKQEFQKIFDRLGIVFDLERGESYYNEQLEGVIQDLVDRGIATQSEGALVVDLEAEGLKVCLVRKSDGGFNYASTDIATLADRMREFQPDRIVYVTDDRQQLHFKQVFSIARKIGIEVELEHVGFGLMRMKEGTIKTRDGNVIRLESLLDEAVSRARTVIEQGSPGMADEHKTDVSEKVGIGAVKYADLSHNPSSVITFDWETALSLEGNSGPYLQYAVARILSVLDKYPEQFPGKSITDYPVVLNEPVERRLAARLQRFPDTVVRAGAQNKPNLIADYLYELAQVYSNFYQTVPFLKADEGVRESRLRICLAVAAVLRKGLDLLGIDTPERI